MIKKDPINAKGIIDLANIRKDLYVVYYDEKDKSINLDIKAALINSLANGNPLVIPLLIKTLTTAAQMLSEDYLKMLEAAIGNKKKGAIHITDALPEPSMQEDNKSH